MAKPHKFAWNGIDVETVLSFEQLANMAQRAAQECAGDLLHGKQRIASTRSSERQIEFRISDFLITFKKFLVFHLDFEPRNGRNWMSSWIDWYVTTRPTVGGFIPVAAKTMSGHNTYLEFVRHLAAQVESADPQARVIIREGVAVSGSAAGSDPPAQGTKVSMPDPGDCGTAHRVVHPWGYVCGRVFPAGVGPTTSATRSILRPGCGAGDSGTGDQRARNASPRPAPVGGAGGAASGAAGGAAGGAASGSDVGIHERGVRIAGRTALRRG